MPPRRPKGKATRVKDLAPKQPVKGGLSNIEKQISDAARTAIKNMT